MYLAELLHLAVQPLLGPFSSQHGDVVEHQLQNVLPVLQAVRTERDVDAEEAEAPGTRVGPGREAVYPAATFQLGKEAACDPRCVFIADLGNSPS